MTGGVALQKRFAAFGVGVAREMDLSLMRAIDIRDILKATGLSKTVDLCFDAVECGIGKDDCLGCEFDEPFNLHAELFNINGIIRVKARLLASYKATCARCLQDVRATIDKVIDEEFVEVGSKNAIDEDLYSYTEKTLDVSLAVRDAALLEIPIRHLCEGGCEAPVSAGCVAVANDDAEADPRFAVLRNYGGKTD